MQLEHEANDWSDSKNYFLQLAELLDSNSPDPEQLIEKALQEIKGHEVKLSSDPESSKAIKKIITGASVQQLTTLLDGYKDEFAILANSIFGSHVLESLLAAFQTHLAKEPPQELLTYLIKFFKSIRAQWGVLLKNDYGNFFVRAAVRLLSGVEVRRRDERFPPAKFYAAPKLFVKKGLKGIAKALRDELTTPELTEVAYHSSGCPTFQALLEALHEHRSLRKILHALVEKALPVTEEGRSQFEDMSCHHTASRMIECLLKVSSNDYYAEFYTKFCRGRLLEMCEHPAANFVVQRLIAFARDGAQVQMCLQELEDSFGKLLSSGRGGVLLQLLEASLKHSVAEKAVVKAVVAAASTLRGRPPPLPLTNQDKRAKKKDKKKKKAVEKAKMLGREVPDEETPEVPVDTAPRTLVQALLEGAGARPGGFSPVGALIASALLKFPNEKVVIDSFLSLDPEFAQRVARDAAGSRLIETFLPIAKPGDRKKFVQKFAQQYAQLALDKFGSHCVDNFYKHSDVAVKETIVAELVEQESKLATSTYGKLVLRNCKALHYKAQSTQWREKQSANEKKRRAFEDFLEEDTKKSASAPPAKKAKATTPVKAVAPVVQAKNEDSAPASDEFMSDVLSAIKQSSTGETKKAKKKKSRK